jgi:hypothetical protein
MPAAQQNRGRAAVLQQLRLGRRNEGRKTRTAATPPQQHSQTQRKQAFQKGHLQSTAKKEAAPRLRSRNFRSRAMGLGFALLLDSPRLHVES